VALLSDAAQQSSDFRQYMLQNDAQNFVNCTFAGGILMAVCSTIHIIFAGGLDRVGHHMGSH
jgi:hypothetical protein